MTTDSLDTPLMADSKPEFTKPEPNKPKRRFGWGWLMLAVAAAGFLCALLMGWAAHDGFDVVIDGETLEGPAAVFGILVATLAVAFAIVVAIVALLGAGIAVALAILLALGAVLLALSPFWLPVLGVLALFYWLVRRKT